MTRLAFLDTETTGLDPDRHEVWEVGLIVREDDGSEHEHQWQLPVDLGRADPMALNIGRFHERRPQNGTEHYGPGAAKADGEGLFVLHRERMPDWATEFVSLTRGADLVGAVISFDADRLWRLLRSLGECPMWHYHLIDVEALAAGWLAGSAKVLGGPHEAKPPWRSDDLSALVGVDPATFDRHTALGDARWARAMYDAVMNP